MANLEVGSLTVAGVLDALHLKKWVVPAFQREFVWTSLQVEQLTESVLRSRPIGMATLWELDAADSAIEEQAIELRDANGPIYFEHAVAKHEGSKYAILDGRQRCTALAMAFGGFRTTDGRMRTSGRLFFKLDAGPEDPWVFFFKEADVIKRGLVTPSAALSLGWMPIECPPDEHGRRDIASLWQKYLITINSEEIYAEHIKPAKETLSQRTEMIETALRGINSVQLATYTVGSSFDLTEICEIFEVLNTTGTQVSTVDLIHSFIYQDTGGALNIRNWIDELGQVDGAEGWASTSSKPERVAQMVTAAYLGIQSELRPPPRPIQGKFGGQLTSIKAGDLLRTPTQHWRDICSQTETLGRGVKVFQEYVSGGRFPLKSCPYPASISVFLGVWWSRETENAEIDSDWGNPELKSLFRAFFWSNALTGRYDQGFLTKVGADIRDLRKILRRRSDCASFGEWLVKAQEQLEILIDEPVPGEEVLAEWIYSGSPNGARAQALQLLLESRVTTDLISGKDISYPCSDAVDLHHVFPKAWIANNRTGDLKILLDEAENNPGWNRINCVGNFIPLSQASNIAWKATNPAAFIDVKNITFESHRNIFDAAFISKQAFIHLASGSPDDVGPFQEERARVMAKTLYSMSRIQA